MINHYHLRIKKILLKMFKFFFFYLMLNKKIKQQYLSWKCWFYSFCGLFCFIGLVGWFGLLFVWFCFGIFFPIAPFPPPLVAEKNVCQFRLYLNVGGWHIFPLCFPVLFIWQDSTRVPLIKVWVLYEPKYIIFYFWNRNSYLLSVKY